MTFRLKLIVPLYALCVPVLRAGGGRYQFGNALPLASVSGTSAQWLSIERIIGSYESDREFHSLKRI